MSTRDAEKATSGGAAQPPVLDLTQEPGGDPSLSTPAQRQRAARLSLGTPAAADLGSSASVATSYHDALSDKSGLSPSARRGNQRRKGAGLEKRTAACVTILQSRNRGDVKVEMELLDEAKTVKAFLHIVESVARSLGVEWPSCVEPNQGAVWLEDYKGRLTDTRLAEEVLPSDAKFRIFRESDRGHPDGMKFDTMYNLVPKAGVLTRSSTQYTFYTAVAELVDNCLQAIWMEPLDTHRRISIKITDASVEITDSGCGMDEQEINSWGTVGDSRNVNVHDLSTKVPPPFRLPYIGKFGVGAKAACFHLGRAATVQSKKRGAKQVTELKLDMDKLEESQWQAAGSVNSDPDPSQVPYKGFTRVTITKLNAEACTYDSARLRTFMKDVYHKYLLPTNEAAEVRPDQREQGPVSISIDGGELNDEWDSEIQRTVALGNFQEKGGPLIVDLEFSKPALSASSNPAAASTSTGHSMEPTRARARLELFYLPFADGEEQLESTLEANPNPGVTFSTAWRTAFCWMARWLPDANLGFPGLPFQSLPPRATQAQKAKEPPPTAMNRVRGIVYLDGGFTPSETKTALAVDKPFNRALMMLGEKDEVVAKSTAKGVKVKIRVLTSGRSGPRWDEVTNVGKLAEQYRNWVFNQHRLLDDEVKCDQESKVLVLCDDQLRTSLGGIDLEMVTFLRRAQIPIDGKPGTWEASASDGSQQLRVKMAKGRFATIEWFLYPGMDESPADIRFVYRPHDRSQPDRCRSSVLTERGEFPRFRLGTGCEIAHVNRIILQDIVRVNPADWAKMIRDEEASLPGYVDILNEEEAAGAGEKAFPHDGAELQAGEKLPNAGVLVRPRVESKGGRLAKCNIVQKRLEVRLDVQFTSTAGEVGEYSHKEAAVWLESQTKIKGPTYFFTFPTVKGKPYLWEAGTYRFTFVVSGQHDPPVKPLVRTITVRPRDTVAKWWLAEATSSDDALPVRLGIPFNLRVRQEDKLGNRKAFDAPLPLRHKFFAALPPYSAIEADRINLKHGESSVSDDGMELEVADIILTSALTPELREVCLRLMPASDAPVFRHVVSDVSEETADRNKAEIFLTLHSGPGYAERCSLQSNPPLDGTTVLRPDQVFDSFVMTFRDQFGNPLEKGTELTIDLDGFEMGGNKHLVNETDENGQISLGGELTVSGTYGSTCKIVVSQGDTELLSKAAEVVGLHIHLEDGEELSGIAGGALDEVTITLVDPDGNFDSDAEGSWALWLDPKAKKAPPGRTFENGRAVLEGVVLPRRLGVVDGLLKVTVQRGGLRTDLEKAVKIQVNAGPVRMLDPVSISGSVPCGATSKLSFRSFDANKLAAPLPNDVLQQLRLSLDGQAQDAATLGHVSQAELVDGTENEYAIDARLEGVAGSYHLKLSLPEVETSRDSMEEPRAEARLAAKWKIRLCAGEFDKLEAVMEESPVTTTMRMVRGEWLDGLTARAFDSQENVCTQRDRESCIVEIAPVGAQYDAAAASQRARWVDAMRKGKVTFSRTQILLEAGKYRVHCWLENSLEKPTTFDLRVEEGNYPRDIRLPDPSPMAVDLGSESGTVLETLYVDLLSADRCRLRSLEEVDPPVLQIKRHDTGEMVGKELIGRLQAEDECADREGGAGENSDEAGPSAQERPAKRARTKDSVKKEKSVKSEGAAENEADEKVTRFSFVDVPVPTKAGEYFLDFSHTHEYKLGSGRKDTRTRVRSVEVRHGLPAELHFATRMRKTVAEGEELAEAGRPVEVTLRDVHKNVCTRISGLAVALFVRGDQAGSSSAEVPEIVSAVDGGTVEAVVTDGKAVFEAVKMGSGGAGIYSFACGLAESELAREEMKEWMKSLKEAKSHFVYRNPEEEGHVLGDKARLTGALRDARNKEASLRSALERLVAEQLSISQKAQASASKRAHIQTARKQLATELGELEIRARAAARRIHELERAETAAGQRNSRAVLQDFRGRRPWAAVAQLAVQTPGSGLHPDDFRQADLEPELLGVVAFLGRVEDDTLNTRLMEWIGGKKDSVVCRTEEGRAACIDVRSPNGSIDRTRGLAGLAGRLNVELRGRYDVIPLDKPGVARNFFSGPILENHQQKLLSIASPMIRGQPPEGFLGYAVNLIHLSPEQLDVDIRVPSESGTRTYGLRASLFFFLFGRLQVYDTDAHKRAAARELGGNFNAVTIGPGSITRPDREVSGFAPEDIPGVNFERVPWSERKQCSLYPPELSRCLDITEEYTRLEATLSQQTDRLREQDVECQAYEQMRATLQEETSAVKRQLQETAREIASVQGDLQKLMDHAKECGMGRNAPDGRAREEEGGQGATWSNKKPRRA